MSISRINYYLIAIYTHYS